MNFVNGIGLIVCLSGISIHVIVKAMSGKNDKSMNIFWRATLLFKYITLLELHFCPCQGLISRPVEPTLLAVSRKHANHLVI